MSGEQNPFEQCAKLAERYAEDATNDCSEAGFWAAYRFKMLAQEIRGLGGIAPEPEPAGPSLRELQGAEQAEHYKRYCMAQTSAHLDYIYSEKDRPFYRRLTKQ